MRWFRRRQPAWKGQLAAFEQRMAAFERDLAAAESVDEIVAVSEKYVPRNRTTSSDRQSGQSDEPGGPR